MSITPEEAKLILSSQLHGDFNVPNTTPAQMRELLTNQDGANLEVPPMQKFGRVTNKEMNIVQTLKPARPIKPIKQTQEMPGAQSLSNFIRGIV